MRDAISAGVSVEVAAGEVVAGGDRDEDALRHRVVHRIFDQPARSLGALRLVAQVDGLVRPRLMLMILAPLSAA